MATYLDNLPPEVAADIARQRIMLAKDTAAFLGFSLPHFRRLYRAKKVPKPIRLSERKLGWRVGDCIDWLNSRDRARVETEVAL